MSTPIKPQDIRVGDRVRNTVVEAGCTTTYEFVVGYRSDGKLYAKDAPPHGLLFLEQSGTWTLLDRPELDRPVGSRWLDPETDAEYVLDDDGDYMRYRRGAGHCGLGMFARGSHEDSAAIARLTPIRPDAPAVLWPPAAGAPHCTARENDQGHHCGRELGHIGLHASYRYGHHDQGPVYVWGDPR